MNRCDPLRYELPPFADFLASTAHRLHYRGFAVFLLRNLPDKVRQLPDLSGGLLPHAFLVTCILPRFRQIASVQKDTIVAALCQQRATRKETSPSFDRTVGGECQAAGVSQEPFLVNSGRNGSWHLIGHHLIGHMNLPGARCVQLLTKCLF